MTLYRTAESVSPKHPDKVCDQISDALLDAHLSQDPDARVAIDVAGGHGTVFVTGEVTSKATDINVAEIVRRIAGDVEVIEHVFAQSPEIAQGVDTGGAGDQGIMVGYATSETEELLPLEVVLSRRLNQYLYEKWEFDGKTQVTLKDGEIISVVASFQNAPSKELQASVEAWLQEEPLAKPDADSSAAYAARKVAIDYLKKEGAKEVYVYLAYAIGHDQPLEATVVVDGREERVVGYDLSPNGIVKLLDLKRPVYEPSARWGHFGHPDFSWEK
jgi:S-adenosylmethionine synthetase